MTFDSFISSVYALPNYYNWKSWLHQSFEAQKKTNLEFLQKSPLYSNPQFDEDSLRGLINEMFDDAHLNSVRIFHEYFGSKDVELINVFVKAIFYLNGGIKSDPQNTDKYPELEQYESTVLSLLKIRIGEFITELEWRISRLNLFDDFEGLKDLIEVKQYYNQVFYGGLGLCPTSRKNFEANKEEILARLKDGYFSNEASEEDLIKFFSNKHNVFGNKLQWVGRLNQLHYLITQLKRRGAFIKVNYEETVERLVENDKGEPVKALSKKNTTPTKQDRTKLNALIDLFINTAS